MKDGDKYFGVFYCTVQTNPKIKLLSDKDLMLFNNVEVKILCQNVEYWF